MSDTSLSSRVRAELFSAPSVVILTAAVFALGAAYVTQAWANGTSVGFGALLGIGLGVPTLYDEWAVHTSLTGAFLWAVLASVIAFGFYALIFIFLTRFGMGASFSGGLAGGATVALAIAFSLYRIRIA